MITIYKPDNKEKLIEYIGEDIYERQKSNSHYCISIGKDGYFIAFYIYDFNAEQRKTEHICIYCNSSDIVFFGNNPHCIETLNSIKNNKSAFYQLKDFFIALTSKDIDFIANIENSVNEIEDSIISSKKPVNNMSSQIVSFRRLVQNMKRYYSQLDFVIDTLIDNENSAIPKDAIVHFNAMYRRITRLEGEVEHVRECVTQLREAYQAQIDIEQNQIMKIFTVIAAIFLPLTLIVGWYGMNLQMPEYGWHLGYLYVVGLCLAVFAICYWFVKKKRWY